MSPRMWLRLCVLLVLVAGCDRKVAGGRADGAAVFSEVCARCHGLDGVPDPATVARIGVRPLTSARVQREFSDEDIRQQILRGSKNKQMPSFAGALSDEQIDAVIGHVRSLQSEGEEPAP